MTTAELRRRADALGVATSYQDWRGQHVQVGEETLAAILAAMGEWPDGAEHEAPAGASAPVPHGRSWGFALQLYALRSRRSWGHGDLGDLADLAAWSARELGAGFVLINPLHAAEPLPPVSASPYLPMSRRFTSPLYLRIEDIPEYAGLPGADRERIEALAAPLRARSVTSDLIDRDAVWLAKRAALEIIYRRPRSDRRQASVRAVPRAGGPGPRRLEPLVRARRDPRRRLAAVRGAAGRSFGGRGCRAVRRERGLPCLAAMARRRANGGGAGRGPRGRHGHRRHPGPGGGHVPGWRRRLGLPGRPGARHERGRATR